ncbi:M28 family peptidase [Ohtaekwangia koreensis]|uniref:Carboxypeptidase Q n=1 Tax=Ohtaekwangia koreensis TaxID=688867 RepID=A0A1T5IJ12_9BACT|nr:M28 family peptidase [Ohtaekwangia koreensis]SKC39109.1 PA domain-containing protein [Ohtaekwangia koreensis]
MRVFLVLLFGMGCIPAFSQSADESAIRQIYSEELSRGRSYQMLEYLTTEIGARLSGSPSAAAAVEWGRHEMQNFSDSVFLQPVMVPHWIRGQKEVGRVINSKKRGVVEMNVCALGMSVGTGPAGVTGNIVEVKTFDELKQLGEKHIKGKIVFFNRPMDPTKINTFEAYGGAVEQRALGPSEAAKYGATGVIVRSMGLNQEDYPHTGGLRYTLNIPKLPAIAISTKHADLLSKILKEEKDIQFYFETHCETLPDAPSFNVVAEIKGTEFPNEIIVVGGHLDSWDLAQGAHDDGAGCVQSMEVLRLFKAIGYKPKRTIRAVLFMNEENGLRGGLEYARLAELKKEKHIAAIESDDGGFTPRGFTMTATEPVRTKIKSWKPLFEPYGLSDFSNEGGGADIGPLQPQGVPIIGFLPDSQRYFDYHHTKEDTLDKVSKRELELGAASMAALVYLIDKYGL